MNKFGIVYQFLCPNCKCIMVGKNEIEAEQLLDASVRFSALTLPCRVCHQTVECKALVKFFVYAVPSPDSSGVAINPAVPLT